MIFFISFSYNNVKMALDFAIYSGYIFLCCYNSIYKRYKFTFHI